MPYRFRYGESLHQVALIDAPLNALKKIEYEVVNVFTRSGKNGNGLAVVSDPLGLSTERMQSIAKRLGYSETTFVLPPPKVAPKAADYRIRIFTPEKELPFAGHPSIGTLFTLIRNGVLTKKKNYIQQVGKRLIPMRLAGDGSIFMDQGKPKFGARPAVEQIASMLGLKSENVKGVPAVVSTGFPLMIVPLASYELLKKAKLRRGLYGEFAQRYTPAIRPFTIFRGEVRCRMFAPLIGVPEDPATGSGAGPLASYILREGLLSSPKIDILQGVKPGGTSLLRAKIFRAGKEIVSVEVGGSSRHVA